jgi:CRISPR-associated endonuclease/helicase Cas3
LQGVEAGRAEALVDETRVALSGERAIICGSELRLRGFQARLLGLYREAAAGRGPLVAALSAPTGSGKTLTLLAPLLAGYRRGSLGVYPSRELARDQWESVAYLLERLGCRPLLAKPYVRLYDGVALVYLTSESLEALVEEKGYQSKSHGVRAIAKALALGMYEGRVAVVFTVPEYAYLLSSASYTAFEQAGGFLSLVAETARMRGPEGLLRERRLIPRREAVEQLSMYSLLAGHLLFVDEYHAYDEASRGALAALAAVSLAVRGRYGFIVFSSATPREGLPERVVELAERLGARLVRVDAGEGREDAATVRRRTLVVSLGLVLEASGAPAFALAQWRVPDLAPRLLEEARGRLQSLCGSTWRRAMVFVDRVALVYMVADRLVEAGYRPGEIACVTSLRASYRHPSCGAHDPRAARIVVGNEAISYGVDIPEVDVAIVYARSWQQALQRIGRVGRGPHPSGCPAIVYLPVPGYALRRAPRGRLSYQGLAEALEQLYPGMPEIVLREEREAATARAAVYLSAALAADTKQVIDTLGYSDVTENQAVEVLAEALRLHQQGLGLLARAGIGAEGVYRLYSLRPGLTARLCGGREASLPMLLRNTRLAYHEDAGCFEVAGPGAERYGALVLSAGGAGVHRRLRGAVLSLHLYSLATQPQLRLPAPSQGYEYRRLQELLEAGAIPPQQPITVLVAEDPEGENTARLLAALGEALLVLDERGNIVGAVAPV